MRDDTKHATERKATRQLVLPTSEVNDDIHLTVKEELTGTNTEDIERINIGSNKICIREDLCEGEDGVSKESIQAIFNMGYVEVNDPVPIHHAFTTYLREHFFATAARY